MGTCKKALLLLVILFGFNSSATAKEITLDDISFMVGHWKGEGDFAPEEQWYPPEGGLMPGFFRWPMEDGKQVFELLNFVETEGGITFRFKHFEPDLTPWEKAEANTYKVTKVEDNCLYMDLTNINDKVPAGIRYCRRGKDIIEFTGRGASETWAEANFIIKMIRVKGE